MINITSVGQSINSVSVLESTVKNFNADDEFSPGLHIVNHHQASINTAFNEIYRVTFVDCCSPKTLEVSEHKYIHELKTLKAFGITSVSPFSIPVLDFIF